MLRETEAKLNIDLQGASPKRDFLVRIAAAIARALTHSDIGVALAAATRIQGWERTQARNGQGITR